MRVGPLRRLGLSLLMAASLAWAGSARSATELLGPDDTITVQALHVPDITEKPIRINSEGYITLPLAGRIHAAGMTVEQLQRTIAARLDEFIQQPQVSVSIADYKSQPISVVGSVNTPGVYQLEGRRTLGEILALAGGPKPDAADRLKITRSADCGQALPDAHSDGSSTGMVAEVSLRDLLEAKNGAANLPICLGDVITIPRAHLIYVMGEVHRPGGFPLRDQESSTVLQALSMSEGLLRTAATSRALILRPGQEGAQRTQIPVDIGAILSGRTSDVALKPEDILLVPNSLAKNAIARTAEALIQVGTGIVIWGKY